jgi:signal transduction histidine kinase
MLGISAGPLNGTGSLWGPGVSTLLMVVAALATAFRRQWPILTLAITGSLAAAEILGGTHIGGYVLLFEALWSPVVHGSRRLARVTTGVGIAYSVLLLAYLTTTSLGRGGAGAVLALMLIAVVIATPLGWGWEVRMLHLARRTAESLADAQRELAAERADRAVEQERRSIAQDLHDVLAGHLSAVALHTRLAESLPDEQARTNSLHVARDSSEAALRDLRSILTVLTEPNSSGTAPLPEASLGWDGLGKRLEVGADPEAARAPTPALRLDARVDDPTVVDPAVRAALLRIAAEAVTNAVTHGSAPRALEVTLEGENVLLDCTNAQGTRHATATDHEGLGLAAMRARARAVGGELVAGPDPGNPEEPGRWRVRARLPKATRVSAGDEETP